MASGPTAVHQSTPSTTISRQLSMRHPQIILTRISNSVLTQLTKQRKRFIQTRLSKSMPALNSLADNRCD